MVLDLRAEGHVLYDARTLDKVIDWMAAQAFALLADAQDPVLVGIVQRGAAIAARLQARLDATHGVTAPLYEIWAEQRNPQDAGEADVRILEPDGLAARDLTQATVLVVDDQLYNGITLGRVVRHLERRGGHTLHTAVLVDRSLGRLPLRPSVAGLCLELSSRQALSCRVPPGDGAFEVRLLAAN